MKDKSMDVGKGTESERKSLKPHRRNSEGNSLQLRSSPQNKSPLCFQCKEPIKEDEMFIGMIHKGKLTGYHKKCQGVKARCPNCGRVIMYGE